MCDYFISPEQMERIKNYNKNHGKEMNTNISISWCNIGSKEDFVKLKRILDEANNKIIHKGVV